MKISFAVSLQKTSFCYIAANGSFLKKASLISKLGYDGIELGIRNPDSVKANQLVALLKQLRLEISAIGTGQAYLDDDLSLTDSNIKIRKQAVERIKKHISLARVLESQVIIGLIRGKKQGSLKKSLKLLLSSIKSICDYSVRNNVVITIEPLNRYETDLLNSAEEAIDFIKQVNCNKLKLLLDTFHMNIEEKDMLQTVNKTSKYISHIHFADNTRRCPGEGSIDFKSIVGLLKKNDYQGYISGEMLPEPSADYCMKRFIKNLKKIGV